ncbi:MAG TPA: hypothetical protein VG939_21790 [Caulobacteraceae bacterium]|nr:hypothetical protein [Caulobacteraceae bacterium]
MVLSLDSSTLLSYYQTKSGLPLSTSSGSGTTSGSTTTKYAPTPPWDPLATAPKESALVQSVMSGRPFINEGSAQLDLPGASDDYRKLFTLYQGLNSLYGLADQAQAKGVTNYQIAQYSKVFAQGLSQVTSYVNNLQLSQLRVTQGAVGASTTSAGVPNQPTTYVTKVIHSGTSSDAVDAFQGNVQFDITVKKGQSTVDVPIDLSQMGSQTRSMGNVVAFINDQLSAAGVFTRFATKRIPGEPRVIGTGISKVTLPALADDWALQINSSAVEQVSFSAPTTNTAVYVTQTAGTPPSTAALPVGSSDAQKAAAAKGDLESQLLKFQTDGTPPPQPAGEANYVDGRLYSKTLDSAIGATHAMTTAPDGSVYVLADVTDQTSDGQTIKGAQDVALQKYDPAGNLVYSRNLGAGVSATGLALSVSSTGQVAIGGSVTGSLNSGETIASSTTSDSFVSLYDANGQEVWTQRRGSSSADQVSALGFGADGTVYVAGQSTANMPGAGGALGGTDGYLEAITTTSKGQPSVKFTSQFGTSGNDAPAGLVVNGSNVVVAGVEQGHAVLRDFDVSGAAPAQTATRDLGDLQGGNIAGVALNASGQVVIAGSTRNGALSAGTVTNAASGGQDAFAATLDASLAPASGDAIAYYGGSGDDKATAMTVSGNQVWLTGTAVTDLPNLTPVGKRDGFLVNLNVATGATDYARRFAAKDGLDAPTAVAVAPGGASILDQIGLPQGAINQKQSVNLIDNTSLRPGDIFYIKTQEGGAERKVSIDAGETLDTLKLKIQRASGFQVNVTTTTVNGERSLMIQPQTAHNTIELVAGPAGHDALDSLGIKAGVVRQTTTNSSGQVVSADGNGTVYGLQLDNDLNLNSADAIKHAAAQLAGAMSTLVGAYRDLKAAATPQPKTTTNKASGPVPTYISNEIANYQAALNRLTGGG